MSFFLLTTLDSAVSDWENLGSTYIRHWPSLDGSGMSQWPVMRKMVLVGQPDASFSQTLGTLGHRCTQALLESVLQLQAMGEETPLVYRGQTCSLYLQATSCSEQWFPLSPGKPAHLQPP